MKRIAAPMIGGILTSFVLELLVYPAVYQIWKWNLEIKRLVPIAPSLVAGVSSLSPEYAARNNNEPVSLGN